VEMGLEMLGNDRKYEELSGNGTGNGRKYEEISGNGTGNMRK